MPRRGLQTYSCTRDQLRHFQPRLPRLVRRLVLTRLLATSNRNCASGPLTMVHGELGRGHRVVKLVHKTVTTALKVQTLHIWSPALLTIRAKLLDWSAPDSRVLQSSGFCSGTTCMGQPWAHLFWRAMMEQGHGRSCGRCKETRATPGFQPASQFLLERHSYASLERPQPVTLVTLRWMTCPSRGHPRHPRKRQVPLRRPLPSRPP